MPVKHKPKVRARIKAKRAAAPTYVCRDCGVELTVTGGSARVTRLICCDRPMKRKK